MTNSITLSLIALAAGASFAAAAQAQDIHVSTYGKAPKVVRAEFIRAAQQVCAGESNAGTYLIESARTTCVRDTLAKAEADYRQIKGVQLAMNRGE